MENELKTNAVKLSPDEQYQIRKSIVRLLKKGKANGEIAEILDVSERHVRSVKKQYAEGGLAALKPKKRGRSIGEKRILTPEQEKEIQKILVDKDPMQLLLQFCDSRVGLIQFHCQSINGLLLCLNYFEKYFDCRHAFSPLFFL